MRDIVMSCARLVPMYDSNHACTAACCLFCMFTFCMYILHVAAYFACLFCCFTFAVLFYGHHVSLQSDLCTNTGFELPTCGWLQKGQSQA